MPYLKGSGKNVAWGALVAVMVLTLGGCSAAGEIALGGGWSVPYQVARVYAVVLSGSIWSVSVAPIGHPAMITVTAYVECLINAPGSVVTRYVSSNEVGPHQPLQFLMSACSAIEVPVGR
jgi:hypothetical protein